MKQVYQKEIMDIAVIKKRKLIFAFFGFILVAVLGTALLVIWLHEKPLLCSLLLLLYWLLVLALIKIFYGIPMKIVKNYVVFFNLIAMGNSEEVLGYIVSIDEEHLELKNGLWMYPVVINDLGHQQVQFYVEKSVKLSLDKDKCYCFYKMNCFLVSIKEVESGDK